MFTLMFIFISCFFLLFIFTKIPCYTQYRRPPLSACVWTVSVLMQACPTVEWVERIQGLLQSVNLGASLTIQTWFRLLGKLTAASAITQLGLLHLRPQHGASSTQMGHDRGHSQVTCGGRADFCCMVFLSAQSQRGKRH